MKLRKKISGVFASPLIIRKWLKKCSIDNFVLGLIFGALFSLLVNIATVKVQEDINKQRTLEALEREIVSHHLTVNNIMDDLDSAFEKGDEYYFYPTTIGFRLSTRVFESDAVGAHLFEIDPEVAAKIETYYDFIVRSANRELEINESVYNELAKECQIMYDVYYDVERESVEKCNDLTKKFLTSNTAFAEMVYGNVEEIREHFHPTQNRLNSFWLKLLLGGKAYEVMKIYGSQYKN